MATTKLTKKQKEALRKAEENNSLNITDILGLCISNWYWFVISLAVCIGIALIYLRMTPPVYTRSCSIVVKDDASGKELDNVFSKYRSGRTPTSTSLNNEMIALKKPSLMTKVVERLHLDFDYQVQGRLRNTTLYGASLAYTVEMPSIQNQNVQFRMKENKDKTVTLKFDKKSGTGDGEIEITVKPGQKIESPLGTITVNKTGAHNSNPDDDITVIHKSMADASASYLGKLDVQNTNEESTVIDLLFQDVNIERADDVLNTLIAIYNEQWMENRNQVLVTTNEFIKGRLKEIERELGDVESEMTNFKVSRHTLDYKEEGSTYKARSMEFEAQGQQLNNEMQMARYLRGQIAGMKDVNQTLPSSAGINNPNLATQILEYNQRVAERGTLSSGTSDTNPLVVDIDKQLAVLRHGILVTIDNHIGILSTQSRILSANNRLNNAQIDATPTNQKLFVDIERRRNIKEQLYTYLLQTREQNELNKAFAAYNTRVLQPAGGSKYQSTPDVKKVHLIALAIGLLLPLAIIVLREWMNTKVRGRRDIEKMTVPFVGELPFMHFKDEEKKSLFKKAAEKIDDLVDNYRRRRGKKVKTKDKLHTGNRIVVKHGSRNVINEAYRVLRTNLEFVIGQNKDHKVIMTTSANPGSGKTFISYNLALCMSLKKKKVVAVDLDLRRRNLSAFVDKPKKGISDYINGNVDDWHDILVKAEGSDHLYVLPVGTLPPNPAELLAYDKFAELVKELREEFDYIFFDCPPVEIVADTSIIAKYADITLFVVRVGLMELEFLNIIEEYYTDHKFNNMGLILNGTLTANSRYGYRRYGYRYGYGYGYGYGGYGYYGSGYSSGYSEGYSKGFSKD